MSHPTGARHDPEEPNTIFSVTSTQYLPFLRSKNSSHVVIMEAGHLVSTRNWKLR